MKEGFYFEGFIGKWGVFAMWFGGKNIWKENEKPFTGWFSWLNKLNKTEVFLKSITISCRFPLVIFAGLS